MKKTTQACSKFGRVGIVLGALCSGCNEPLFIPEPAKELVLAPRTRLEAQWDGDTLTIEAGAGTYRNITWEGCKFQTEMGARSTRWFGELGAYEPGPNFFSWSSLLPSGRRCRGVSRVVISEAQLHMPDDQFLAEWLVEQSKMQPTFWADEGIVLQWYVNPLREEISISLSLLCKDKRPAKLPVSVVAFSGSTPALGTVGKSLHCELDAPKMSIDAVEAWRDLWRSAALSRRVAD